MARWDARGVRYVHAPVFMAPANCAEGTGWMFKIADRIRRGQGRLEDLDLLVEVGDRIGIMPGTTICGLADGAGWPVKTIIRKFRPEFESYIKAGRKGRSLSLVGAH